MDPVTAKCLTVAILLFITLMLGTLPYFIIKRGGVHTSRTRDRVLSFLNCFAGGVFLGTCLLHLFVDGRKDLEQVLEQSYNFTGYPMFEVFVGSGFFLICVIEKLAYVCIAGTAVIANMNTPKQTIFDPNCLTEKTPLIGQKSSNYRDVTFAPKPTVDNRPHDLSRGENGSELERSISHTDDLEPLAHASGIRAVLLLIAMSFHTIFDGLAVGLQKSSEEVWEMFGAICIHKCLVAFCLGFQLFRAFQLNIKKSVGCLLLFSLMSPIGISIGIALTSSQIDFRSRHMSSGILQGVACGTFLYVTCFEILKDELSHHGSIGKIVVAVLGFAVMAGVKVLDKD